MNRNRLAHAAGAGTLLVALTLLGAACAGDGEDDRDAAETFSDPGVDADAAVRPEVVFAAGGPVIEIPDEVPSGFVDIRVEALEGEGTHFLLARLNDGVTYEQVEVAADDEFFDLVDVVGGNGTITAGNEMLMTVEFPVGDYIALNIYGAGAPQFAIDRFRAVDQGNQAPPPEADGTIQLGPDMRIITPEGFDATGVWRFENRDPELTHEAAIVGLAPASTAEDLVQWFHTQAGPPPIVGEFGSMGALGPGNEAWVDFGTLAAGDYALVCFVPGATGIPHAAEGMVSQVTVGDIDS